MNLLTGWGQWLPHVIFIEIAIIVLVGTILVGLLTWKWGRRWLKKKPQFNEFLGYQDLPSAESFLDDWTMSKATSLSPAEPLKQNNNEVDDWQISSVRQPEKSLEADVVVSDTAQNDVIISQPPQNVETPFEGEEIENVLRTIIHVKKDLKQKSKEIVDLSKRLNRQQTISKFAIKEKLLAIRKAEFNRKELEQEVKSMEQERNKAFQEVVKQENKTYFETKAKMESVSKLMVKEKLATMKKAELEMKALEQEISNLEVERDRAYETIKEKEVNSFIEAKKKLEGVDISKVQMPRKRFEKVKSAITKFKPVFNVNFFKAKVSPRKEIKKREIKFSMKEDIKTKKPVPKPIIKVEEHKPFTPPKDGQKTIAITVPPELMS